MDRLDVVDESYVGHDPSLPEELHGPQGFKDNVSMFCAAYSDARITVDDQIAEGTRSRAAGPAEARTTAS